MKEKFRDIPQVLKKHIIARIVVGVLSAIVSLIILFTFDGLYFAVPFIVLATVSCIGGVLMLNNCLWKRYVKITGECVDVSVTALKKRINSVTVDYEDKRIKVITRLGSKRINVGDNVDIYIPDNAQVYEKGSEKIITDFYAITVEK